MNGRLCHFLALLLSLGVKEAVSNSLVAHDYAVDETYRACAYRDFRGEYRNLTWDDKACHVALQASGAQTADAPTSPAAFRGTYYSQPIRARFAFSEFLPSWNVVLDERTQGYRVRVRVADAAREWSPWFYFGGAGVLLDEETSKTLRDEAWGRVDVDYLLLKRPAVRFQYCVELASTTPPDDEPAGRVALKRFFATYSNTDGDEKLWKRWRRRLATLPDNWATTLSVPYRSQLWVEEKELRGQICCPTCVSMVLESNGIDLPTTVVAQAAYDREYEIYGVWPRASQVAGNLGLEAWVARFRCDEDVKRMIARGVPVMASIRVKPGELANAFAKGTSGHLILLRGMTASGDYIVNDPATVGPGGAEIIYTKEEIAKVWFAKGGVGIVIRSPDFQKQRGK